MNGAPSVKALSWEDWQFAVNTAERRNGPRLFLRERRSELVHPNGEWPVMTGPRTTDSRSVKDLLAYS